MLFFIEHLKMTFLTSQDCVKKGIDYFKIHHFHLHCSKKYKQMIHYIDLVVCFNAYPTTSCSTCLTSNPSYSAKQGLKAPGIQRRYKILWRRLQELRYNTAITCTTDSKPFLSEALFVRILTNKIGVGFCSSLERKSWMLQQGHFNHEW